MDRMHLFGNYNNETSIISNSCINFVPKLSIHTEYLLDINIHKLNTQNYDVYYFCYNKLITYKYMLHCKEKLFIASHGT